MMVRLTEHDEFGNADIIGVGSEGLQGNLMFDELNLVTAALNRLAAYEDTGLTPEEVVKLMAKNADLRVQLEPPNEPLTLTDLQEMQGEPVWIQVLDRPDLSRWHFIVHDSEWGIVAKDSLGIYEVGRLTGCCFNIQSGHHYGVNWLAYRHKPTQE